MTRPSTSDFDWKAEIVKLVYVKQALAEVDKHKLWPWHLPSVAASEAEIRACEQYLGFPLDPLYAAFLRHANGWRGFYHAADLFGTQDLCGGNRMLKAQEILSYIEGNVFQQSQVTRDELFPVAVSPLDLDLFVMTKPSSRQPGIVIWFATYEIQRFPNFQDFFLAMVDYNRSTIQTLSKPPYTLPLKPK